MKWLQKWLKPSSKSNKSDSKQETDHIDASLRVLELKGRTIQKHIVPEVGMSILELAMKNDVDWNSYCKRGTCARCRCHVDAGPENLSEPNEAEQWRLTEEEIEEGFRLGCQTKVVKPGKASVKHSPYF